MFTKAAVGTVATIAIAAGAAGAAKLYNAHQTSKLMDSIVDRTTANLRDAIQRKLTDNHDMLHDKQEHINGSIQTMADGEEGQQSLQKHLRDPLYSRANFVDININQGGNTFISNFGEGRLIEFSNRLSNQNELRGERLQGMLANSDYNTLADIASHDHLRPADPRLSMVLAATIMTDFSGNEIFKREERQQLTPEQRDEVHQRVRAQYQLIDILNGITLNQFVGL